MTDPNQPELMQVLAENVRRYRLERDLSQDALAEDARNWGLGWGRTTVADLEASRRGVMPEELVLLPALLGVGLADLLTTPQGARVAGLELKRHEIAKLVSGSASKVRLPRIVRGKVTGGQWTGRGRQWKHDRVQEMADHIGRREAEAHAAKVLDKDPVELLEACIRLWNCFLTEERDRRLAQDPREGDVARRRGWITRQLLQELRNYFEGEAK